MFKHEITPEDIEVGSFYECINDGHNAIAVAEVLVVNDGPFGIPHVRFQMSYRCSDREENQGVRVLALKVFAERYRLMREAA